MPLVAGERYAATVQRPQLTTSEAGNDGIAIHFDCGAHGGINHTIWLTAARLEYAEKELNALGVPSEQLRREDFGSKICEWIDGKPCEIVTKEEEGTDGKTRVRVAFINGAAREARPGAPKRLANLFSGGGGDYGARRSSAGAPPASYDPDAPSDADAPPPRRGAYGY